MQGRDRSTQVDQYTPFVAANQANSEFHKPFATLFIAIRKGSVVADWAYRFDLPEPPK